MDVLIGVLITFLVVILVLYLVNMLPIDGRAKQIVRVIVIILGDLAAEISRGLLGSGGTAPAPGEAPRRRSLCSAACGLPPDSDSASSCGAFHASLIEASLAELGRKRTRTNEAERGRIGKAQK